MSSRARDGILNEAARLFGDQGYPGTSMREIASAVGLLPGSLYAHIRDKEGLLVEIVETGIDRFLAAAQPIIDAPEPADVRLRLLIKAHIGVIAENVQRTTVVFHQWKHLSDGRRAGIVSKRNRYEQIFTRLVDEGTAAGAFSDELDPRITVVSILGILNWVPEWYSPEGPRSPDEVSDRVANVLLGGLLVRPGTP